MQTIEGDIYDYPRYYDLIFGSDWKPEYDFLNGCFQKHLSGKAVRVFEPACGTGRLLYRLGKQGLLTSGLDLNPKAVDYCNRRLKRHGLPASAVVGDMTDFRLPRKVDAAFNMINSFRHLSSEKLALAHLRCMGEALRKGGIYLLGLHLTPTKGYACEEESWSASRGHLTVNTHMWLLERNLRRREELYGMRFDIYTPTESFRLEDRLLFRTYKADQIHKLIADAGVFDLVETYDFAYDIDAAIDIDRETEDIVLVLKKK
ncbi:class I SAM-dependent methyltransferase [Lignipirellula cremea]|uniref:dTDP-3-amino-3,4, 6-trideoxy-alpha-D-glucopyranose n=1 Tax=Lignipirellula cremea TaxID=2528010 RepID=A0A518DN89_9BACT|nr:class I SAM-dependent methyltransferase [Lignipirellula cremea]QDU93304.1 dTDP-3-amino-3,4,6-trideoxy-alpha-D-glucopyranose [Lignipirellula cremea]